MAFDVGSVVAHIKADVSDFKNGINSAKDQVGGLGNTMNGIAETIKTGFVVASAAAAAGIALVGKSALQAAADFEQTKISFEVMLGSASKAQKLLADLQEFAKKTPFNLVELQEATKRLLAYGIEGDKMIETLRMLGDITSGVGREKLPQLILAFGQVKAATKLTGMELRQFSEAGVPLLQALVDQANKAGGSWQTVGASAKKSKVDVAELNDKLAIASQRLKEAEGNAKTKQSTLMSLRNTVQNYTQDIAKAGAATAGTGKVWVTTKVTAAEMIEKISDGEITFAQVQSALAGMTDKGGKFFEMMDRQSKTFSGSLSNLQDSWTQLLVVLGTIFIPIATEVVQAITGMLAPIVQIIQTSGSWQEAMNRMGIDTQGFMMVVDQVIRWFNETAMPAINVFITWWKNNWQIVAIQFKGIWDIIIGIVQVAWAVVYAILSVGLELIAGDWKGAWDRMREALEMAWNGIKSIFIGIVEFISGWGSQVFQTLTEPFRRAWNEIQNLVNKIKDALDFTKRHSPSVVDIVNRGVNEVNKALSGLQFNTSLTKEAAAVAVSNGGESTRINSISVSLDGAIIADEAGANHMAELLGDRIIKILQGGVRF